MEDDRPVRQSCPRGAHAGLYLLKAADFWKGCLLRLLAGAIGRSILELALRRRRLYLRGWRSVTEASAIHFRPRTIVYQLCQRVPWLWQFRAD